MGRAGIRRRKPKRVRQQEPETDDDAGILADLHDQAEWSSYGSHIPRLGNPRRDRIWWNRGFRAWGNVRRYAETGEVQGSTWRDGVLAGAVMIVAAAAGIFLVVVVLGWLFD